MKNIFKMLFEKQAVIVVKKEYRRKYKINWRQFRVNVRNLFLFWKNPVYRRFHLKENIANDEIIVRSSSIDASVKSSQT